MEYTIIPLTPRTGAKVRGIDHIGRSNIRPEPSLEISPRAHSAACTSR